MNIRLEQLDSHLSQTLASVYCVMGDEPLQSMEAVDTIRAAAAQAGYHNRDILSVEAKFDWSALSHLAESLSLFSEKQIIDLRIPTGKWGIQGSKAIQAYLSKAPSDKLLIIQLGAFDYRSRHTAWFKAIDQSRGDYSSVDIIPATNLGMGGKADAASRVASIARGG